MEFAWNTQKNKMGDIKGKEMEQERTGKISNNDIDLDRSHLNFDFVESNKTLYQRVKNRVEEVRSVSRVQKNSVVDFSNIITVPKVQFEEWGIDRSRDYLREVYSYFCNEFGKENVVSAKVHLDETTPHMHLHFVPVNQENGKLQARNVMTPARINSVHTKATKYLQEKGFEVERGKGKTENNLDIHRFKAEKMKEDINMLETKLKALEGDLTAFNDIKGDLYRIESLNAKKSLVGSKISIKEEDYKMLVNLSKKSFVIAPKISSLQNEVNTLNDKLKKKELNVDEKIELAKLKKTNGKLLKRQESLEENINIHNDFIKALGVEKDFNTYSKSKTVNKTKNPDSKISYELIKTFLDDLMSSEYENFIKALLSIETGEENISVLDRAYKSYLESDVDLVGYELKSIVNKSKVKKDTIQLAREKLWNEMKAENKFNFSEENINLSFQKNKNEKNRDYEMEF